MFCWTSEATSSRKEGRKEEEANDDICITTKNKMRCDSQIIKHLDYIVIYYSILFNFSFTTASTAPPKCRNRRKRRGKCEVLPLPSK